MIELKVIASVFLGFVFLYALLAALTRHNPDIEEVLDSARENMGRFYPILANPYRMICAVLLLMAAPIRWLNSGPDNSMNGIVRLHPSNLPNRGPTERSDSFIRMVQSVRQKPMSLARQYARERTRRTS